MPEAAQTPDKTRERLAFGLSITAVVGIVVLAAVAILVTLNAPDGKSAQVKDILTLLLPVFGTWIGTVLAFYFTKENLEAARRNVDTLVQRVVDSNKRLEDILTNEVMYKFPAFTFQYIKTAPADFNALELTKLIAFMEITGTERLPIVVEGPDTLHFLIYRSTLERFLSDVQADNVKYNPGYVAKGTINDMVNSTFTLFKDIEKLRASQPFVRPDAKLAEVQRGIQGQKLCHDVFVTEDGTEKGKLLGWVTDELIAGTVGMTRSR